MHASWHRTRVSGAESACVLGLLLVFAIVPLAAAGESVKPNILLAIADDWGLHAGAYGDAVVQTPTFDRLADEGLLFEHAYVSSPSCTPSRGALLTGQWHWRLGAGGNLWSRFPDQHVTYPELLRQAGYAVGHSGKGWGPGTPETPERELAGKRFRSFEEFLEQRPTGAPFCFWLGTSDPHRPFKRGSGSAAGIPLDKIQLPACFPDHPEVRSDVADYYVEVQRFDALVGKALSLLEAKGELDNTMVVMTSDHGMPFPRCKSNLYDSGTRVPLAIRWPGAGAAAGRTTAEFVSLIDLAPTFLEIAQIDAPTAMSGHSLRNLLADEPPGSAARSRDFVLVGKERHVPSQEAPDMGGYPCRGIRTHDYFYIRNFRPDRWPNGTPFFEQAAVAGNWYADTDNGPTKTYMIEHRDRDETHRHLYDLAFAKRPAEELYDLGKDPHQLHNVADDASYAAIKQELAERLTAELRATGDPRIIGQGEQFDKFPYLGGGPKHPAWQADSNP